MSINSFRYILLFLPLTLVLVNLARRLPFQKAPQVIILAASVFFYGLSKPSHLGYLFGSILANWLLARWIASTDEDSPVRKRIFVSGIILNIAFLCTFKYVNFFISNIPWFTHHGIQFPDLAFPLGISFFTLTQIMYLIECYEETIPASSLFDHATFVSFFPYVISGPISRANRILPQFPKINAKTAPSAEEISRAIFLFSMGLIKKVVLADSFSKAADFGFDSVRNMSALEGWVFAFCYAMQIYFDFSGYSDMAIASALFFGIDIPRNFDAPFRSKSIIEFWTRWHISLSQFITAYIYTPIILRMPKVTLFTSAVATLVAMSIAGLWHGPSWPFVFYGIVHGIALACNQYWRKKKMPKIPAFPSWLLTFVVVLIGLIFFRSATLHGALGFMSQLVSWHHPFGIENLREMDGAGIMVVVFAAAQIAGAIIAFVGKSSEQLARDYNASHFSYIATVSFTLIAFLFLNSSISKPFVYFAF